MQAIKYQQACWVLKYTTYAWTNLQVQLIQYMHRVSVVKGVLQFMYMKYRGNGKNRFHKSTTSDILSFVTQSQVRTIDKQLCEGLQDPHLREAIYHYFLKALIWP